jgi:RimJ/RimL family protein N-acetyltransferase
MIELTRAQLATLSDRFLPERPGPLVAQHVINTGNGTCMADRWPDPRALVAETGSNYALSGDPAALRPADLRGMAGFYDGPEGFVPLLRGAFDELYEWPRVVFTLQGPPRRPPPGHLVRRLGPADAGALGGLSREAGWISATWGGPAGLAASGTGWGAFAGGRLVSVACPFYVGSAYEDIGVVTEEDARGRGLSPTCAAAVCDDARARGRTPTWTTSPDNVPSLRAAEKLGFVHHHDDRALVAGMPIPESASPPGDRPARP